MAYIDNRAEAPMKTSLLRNLAMLRHIPRQPQKVDTATLKRHLENAGIDAPTDRTLQRDLIELSAELPLVCDDRSRPYGWSWEIDAEDIRVPTLAPHTALALKLLELHLPHLLPVDTRKHLAPVFRHADQALETIAEQGLNAWKNRVRMIPTGIPRLTPEVESQVEEAIYEGLLHGKAIELDYAPRSGSSYVFLAHPMGMVNWGTTRYLVCIQGEDTFARHLPLHRARSARLTDQDARTLPGFDIDEYIRKGEFEFPVGGRIRLEARVSKRATPTLIESPLSRDQTVTDLGDDTMLLKATVQDTQALRTWLRGYGRLLEVLKPAALRRDLAEEAKLVAKRYSQPPRRGRASRKRGAVAR